MLDIERAWHEVDQLDGSAPGENAIWGKVKPFLVKIPNSCSVYAGVTGYFLTQRAPAVDDFLRCSEGVYVDAKIYNRARLDTQSLEVIFWITAMPVRE